MKKITLTFSAFVIIATVVFCGVASVGINNAEAQQTKAYTAENFPLRGSHLESALACTDCHTEGKNYSTRVKQETCLSCHEDYDALAKKTSKLGYDDNVHASPHYPKMDCDMCHKVHTNTSVNYCAMCHSQETMTKLLVP